MRPQPDMWLILVNHEVGMNFRFSQLLYLAGLAWFFFTWFEFSSLGSSSCKYVFPPALAVPPASDRGLVQGNSDYFHMMVNHISLSAEKPLRKRQKNCLIACQPISRLQLGEWSMLQGYRLPHAFCWPRTTRLDELVIFFAKP